MLSFGRVALLVALLVGCTSPLCAAADAIPFTVAYSDAAVVDLRERLTKTRFPPRLEDIKDGDWSYGMSPPVIDRLVQHLLHDFDWSSQVNKLNQMQQFTMQLGEHNVHFVHQLSSNRNAKPLMLVHGWPGSFWECSKILPMLTEPQMYGGDAADAFHVVCPSIPGYGYSSKPKRKGFDQMECAKLFSMLMHELGYHEYYLQGGDWGSVVTSLQASLASSHTHGKVIGLHLNMVPSAPPLSRGFFAILNLIVSVTFPSWYYTADEWREAQTAPLKVLDQSGYFHEQLTRPLTLGYGLSDSPVGLLAWITEKFQEWSDNGGDLFTRFTEDEILTNFMIYWTTNTAASSVNFYYEFLNGPNSCLLSIFTSLQVKVPTAMALFPVEIFAPVRYWAQYTYTNIIQWNHMPSGGHFAAMEEPLLLAKDLWAFVQKTRIMNEDERLLGEDL